MTNYSYLKIGKTRKIRYLKHLQKNTTYIVFLHGFMSDLEGKKPKTFLNFAKKSNLGFLALEYSGHGKSSGKFINGNISKWTKDTTVLIKRIVKKNKIILVGSSMGSWISLNQFKFFKKQIIGFLGIGSAPEFLENLMWKKFTKKMKSDLIKNGMIHGQKDEAVPVSYSRKVLKIFKNAKKKLVIIKNGDHSLSSPKWLKLLKKELSLIVN
jgi:pimeloyl-ACP methyl ester carboxylesterase